MTHFRFNMQVFLYATCALKCNSLLCKHCKMQFKIWYAQHEIVMILKCRKIQYLISGAFRKFIESTMYEYNKKYHVYALFY